MKTWINTLKRASTLLCLLGAVGAVGCSVESVASRAQAVVGECTTTTQCKQMYGDATDCKNSEGGVCYCGAATCESQLDPVSGVVLPATIQAVEFEAFKDGTEVHFGNCGSGPVDQQVTSDQGGGCNVGWTTAGEWLEYEVNVQSSGSFEMHLRLASAAAGKRVRVLVDGQAVGTVTAPDDGWQSWATRTVSSVSLGGGGHTVRVVFLDGSVNFNWIEFASRGSGGGSSASCSDGVKNQSESGVDCGGPCAACDDGVLGPSDAGNPANYTGESHWDSSSGTLTFLSDGKLPNNHHGWDVPSKVKTIVIGAGVRVSGRFDVQHSMTIEGENRKTSEVFGTNIQGYNKKNDGCGLCKSAVYAEGDITVTVKKLTSLNPYGFHFTGKKKAKFVLDSVDAIDNRGGHGNNSDGVSAGDGTIVRNCYFESGDDIIKVYSDITVVDTEIKMVDNAVPIQFGWGSYGSGAKGVFRNLTITGNSGRYAADRAVISARKGNYDKVIEIDGLTVSNPNATLIAFREASGNASITIDGAKIDVKQFRGDMWSMNSDPKVCGRVYDDGRNAPKSFDCQ